MFTKKHPKINYISRVLCLPLIVVVIAVFTLKAQHSETNRATSDTVANNTDIVVKDIELTYAADKPKFYNGKAVKSVMISEEESQQVTIIYKDDTKEQISIQKAKEVGLIGNKNNSVAKPTNVDIEIRDILFDTVPQQKDQLKGNDDILSFTSGTFIENVPIGEAEKHSGVFIIDGKITVGKWNELHIKKEDIERIMLAKGNVTMKGQHIKANENGILIIATKSNAEKFNKERLHANQPVFQKVEVEPQFPGGTREWRRFLEQNLTAATPVDSGAPAGAYTVVVQFIVNKDGTITDLKALTKHGYGMEQEVLRMMKLSPNWIPAQQNGKVVAAYKKQPVTFVISEGKQDLPNTKAENHTPKSSGYEISAIDFKKLSINQLTRREKDDELKTFELIAERGDSYIKVFNLGNEFSSEMKQLIESVKAGDIVTLQWIKAIVNGKEQRLPSFYYLIK